MTDNSTAYMTAKDKLVNTAGLACLDPENKQPSASKIDRGVMHESVYKVLTFLTDGRLHLSTNIMFQLIFFLFCF